MTHAAAAGACRFVIIANATTAIVMAVKLAAMDACATAIHVMAVTASYAMPVMDATAMAVIWEHVIATAAIWEDVTAAAAT